MPDSRSQSRKIYFDVFYLFAFAIFAVLLALRESLAYQHIYDFLPILGGSIPFFVLTVLLVFIYRIQDGQLKQLGWRWPTQSGFSAKTLLWLVVTAVLILVARILINSLVGPLLEYLGPAADTLSRMQPLAGNLPLLLILLPMMWGFVIAEELLFRGLLINFLLKIFGESTKGWFAVIMISALMFGLAHFWQGPRGMVAAGMGALVFGAGYYLAGRNLLPVILAHCAGNTLGFISIYLSH